MARNDSSSPPESDSSKKVAKAARAGATPSAAAGREQRSLGFPAALAAIIIAGSALVFFAWNSRDVAAFQPTFDDHWHLPFGIYDCTIDGFRPDLPDPQTSNAGIHTHGDGVIHIHPYSSTATGNSARLVRYLEATDTVIEDDAVMSFSDGVSEDLAEGVQCDGEDAVLQIARFAPGSDTPSEVITEDLIEFRFSEDQEGVVIALAPAGADIPPPPAASVAQASAASPNIFATDGLENFDGSNSGNIGFDESGTLIGPDGNPILNDDGEPITREQLEAEATEIDADADADVDTSDDVDAGEDADAGDDADG